MAISDCSSFVLATLSSTCPNRTVTSTVIATAPTSTWSVVDLMTATTTNHVTVEEAIAVSAVTSGAAPIATTIHGALSMATEVVTKSKNQGDDGDLRATALSEVQQATAAVTANATIPAYASACLDSSAYLSGCSCIGVTTASLPISCPVSSMTVTMTWTSVVTLTTRTVTQRRLEQDDITTTVGHTVVKTAAHAELEAARADKSSTEGTRTTKVTKPTSVVPPALPIPAQCPYDTFDFGFQVVGPPFPPNTFLKLFPELESGNATGLEYVSITYSPQEATALKPYVLPSYEHAYLLSKSESRLVMSREEASSQVFFLPEWDVGLGGTLYDALYCAIEGDYGGPTHCDTPTGPVNFAQVCAGVPFNDTDTAHTNSHLIMLEAPLPECKIVTFNAVPMCDIWDARNLPTEDGIADVVTG